MVNKPRYAALSEKTRGKIPSYNVYLTDITYKINNACNF